MKATFEHNEVKVSFEFTPDEVGKFLPYTIRAVFNSNVATIQTTKLLVEKMRIYQHEIGWKKFAIEKKYLNNDDISLFIQKIPFFMKSKIVSRLVNNFEIGSYADSNIFFSILDLLQKKVKKKHITQMVTRLKENNQAAMLDYLEEVERKKPKLLSNDAQVFIIEKNKEISLKSEK